MNYEILYYNDLNYSGLKKKFDKTIELLQLGDFKSAEVKKLKPSAYLRAKLDDTHRLLFTSIKHNDKTYLLILEVIRPLVLKSLKDSNNFFLCGDANQIVHPNFFSWSKLKSHFHQLNFTPLMCAAYMLNEEYVDELLKQGVILTEIDNRNRNAFMIMFARLLMKNKKIGKNTLSALYDKLCPADTSIQMNNKLIKIDAHKIEFLFLNVLIIWGQSIYMRDEKRLKAFNADTVLSLLAHLVGSTALPEFRTKRSYVNSVLSRNEENSKYSYNRKIFKRIRMGVYVLNPNLQIKIGDLWDSPI